MPDFSNSVICKLGIFISFAAKNRLGMKYKSMPIPSRNSVRFSPTKVSLPARLIAPALSLLIVNILSICSLKKMFGINASSIVAPVADEETLPDSSSAVEHPTKTVGFNTVKLPVAFIAQTRFPNPAVIESSIVWIGLVWERAVSIYQLPKIKKFGFCNLDSSDDTEYLLCSTFHSRFMEFVSTFPTLITSARCAHL